MLVAKANSVSMLENSTDYTKTQHIHVAVSKLNKYQY